MNLVLARIDDRLIHGQVVVGWVRHLGAGCIVVANDAIAADKMQRSLLPMAVPPPMKVGIFSVADAVQQLKGAAFADSKLILLFASPRDVVRFLDAGGELSSLNVGGMRYSPGKTQVLNAISIGPEDMQAFRELAARHLTMRVQMVPTDSPEDIMKFIPSGI